MNENQFYTHADALADNIVNSFTDAVVSAPDGTEMSALALTGLKAALEAMTIVTMGAYQIPSEKTADVRAVIFTTLNASTGDAAACDKAVDHMIASLNAMSGARMQEAVNG